MTQHETLPAKVIYIFSALLILIIIHSFQWNSFSIEIIHLKIKQLTGTAQIRDYHRIAAICSHLKKWDCQEKALLQGLEKDPSQTEIKLQLAIEYYQRKNYIESSQYFISYYRSKNINWKQAHHDHLLKMALAFSESKKFDEAQKVFDHLIRLNNDPLKQPHYIRTYVHYLIQNAQYSKAKGLIASVRKSNKQAAYFLEKELKIIELALNKSS